MFLDDMMGAEQLYNGICEAPCKRLFTLVNVHTAGQFGVNVSKRSHEEMAEAIEDADDLGRSR